MHSALLHFTDRAKSWGKRLRRLQRVAGASAHRAGPRKMPDQASLHQLRELLRTALDNLLEEPNSWSPFIRLLGKIEDILRASSSAIFVAREADGRLEPCAWTSSVDRDSFARLVGRGALAEFCNAADEPVRFVEAAEPGMSRLIAVRLGDKTRSLGLLLLKMPAAVVTSTSEIALLEMLGQEIAAILYCARRAQIKRRLALCEERATISRELHDSLAQSLSYLKIQVSRLQSLLDQDQHRSRLDHLEVDTVIEELRNNANLAYRQLRELITTCRLTMNGRNLGQALEDSIEEFEKRSGIAFDLDNRLADDVLAVEAEMQVLHIIREALSNVVRHSRATHATISLNVLGENTIAIAVIDDGIGIDASRRRDQHYGLMVMQERAHRLGGDLRLERRSPGGTGVHVTFPIGPGSASRNASLEGNGAQ